jgi:acetyl-CoA C-acetyltransferase
MSESVFVLSARRTPIGAFQGALAPATAPQLGAVASRAALESAGIAPADLSATIFGCVLSAGLGQAPGRQAAMAAGVPVSVPSTTVNKMCGSGMQALIFAADALRAGDSDLILAGGLESMSNAPYLVPKARAGYRMGHGELLDHMFTDGLQSPWDGQMMGVFGEQVARKFGFTRAEQDAYAAESVGRALRAIESGAFAAELAPVTVKGRKGEVRVERDESPFNCDIARIPLLKPAFARDGTVTAASSSSISDGAAMAVLASGRAVRERRLQPLARLVAHASQAQEPEWFTTAPIGAIRRVLDRAGWSVGDVGLFEINEAFAAVPMAAIRELALDPARVNVNGGACALGHPIGATGARITATLLHAMIQRGVKRGVAALCIGGGESTALALERE